ncbi:tetratricopeptide repeat protein [Aggregatilineales bacterium SYSU G02658]
MMKRLIAVLLLMIYVSVEGQEAAVPAPAEASITPAQLENAVLRAEMAAALAEQNINIAASLLNVFEGVALALTAGVTVGGIVLGVFGIRSIQDTRRVSRELREEAAQLRQQFEQEINKREALLEQLRQRIEMTAQETTDSLQRRTDDALSAIAILEQGELQFKAADYEGAVSAYEKALMLDPSNPFIHQRLGYVYTQLGEIDKASLHYQTAYNARPDDPAALAGVGFVIRRIAEKMPGGVEQEIKFVEAEAYLLKALALSPKLVDDDGESWWGVLGGLYRRRGMIDKAIEAYERATRVTPQSSYGFSNLALLYVKKGQTERMQSTYELVEKIAAKEAGAANSSYWSYADLLVARLALGKQDQALDDLEVALSIVPSNSAWMLEGLRETLLDLSQYVDTPRRAGIQRAVRRITEALHAISKRTEGKL